MILTDAKSKGGDAPSPETVPVSVPFIRGSRKRTDRFHDETNALGSSAVQVGPEDVIARGFLRHVVLEVEFTGGAAGTATVAAAADAPWNVLSNVTLQDVNGNPIVQLGGYALYLANKYGAYEYQSDPKSSPAFSDLDSDGNGKFLVRIPVEISARDGLGALANQNASQTYKVDYTLAPSSVVFDTEPDTLPNVRVKATLESWAQPDGADAFGNPVIQTPPAHGTMQNWTRTIKNVESGDQTLRLPRVGNHIRMILAIFRGSGGARSTTDLPDPLTFYYDGKPQDSVSRDYLRHRIAERYGFDGADDAANGLDTGVIGFDYAHDLDGKVGYEMRDLYLPTHQGTDLEISGSFGAAGTLEVITCDVLAAGGLYAKR